MLWTGLGELEWICTGAKQEDALHSWSVVRSNLCWYSAIQFSSWWVGCGGFRLDPNPGVSFVSYVAQCVLWSILCGWLIMMHPPISTPQMWVYACCDTTWGQLCEEHGIAPHHAETLYTVNGCKNTVFCTQPTQHLISRASVPSIDKPLYHTHVPVNECSVFRDNTNITHQNKVNFILFDHK